MLVFGIYVRVGPKIVNVIVSICTLRHMWEMVIECLWNTFWPDPSNDGV